MTEAEWLTTTHPALMLSHLGETASRRKLVLFGCAAVKRVGHLLTHKHGRRALVAVERFADGLTSSHKVVTTANKAREQIRYGTIEGQIALGTVCGVADALRERAACSAIAATVARLWATSDAETEAQSTLLRELFGNPFRPVVFDPRWRSEVVSALATGIYADQAFDRLPILADALEEAGCDHADILNHCRGPGPHVKGCWVVDLVLGKG